MYNTKPDLPENLREQAGVYTLTHGRGAAVSLVPTNPLNTLFLCAG